MPSRRSYHAHLLHIQARTSVCCTEPAHTVSSARRCAERWRADARADSRGYGPGNAYVYPCACACVKAKTRARARALMYLCTPRKRTDVQNCVTDAYTHSHTRTRNRTCGRIRAWLGMFDLVMARSISESDRNADRFIRGIDFGERIDNARESLSSLSWFYRALSRAPVLLIVSTSCNFDPPPPPRTSTRVIVGLIV